MSVVSYAPFGATTYRCTDFHTTTVVCHLCGALATRGCDFTRDGATCNASLCGACAVRHAPNTDYCPGHDA